VQTNKYSAYFWYASLVSNIC